MGFMKSKKTVLAIILLLLILGVGAYLLFLKDDSPKKQGQVTTRKSATQSNIKVTTSGSNTAKTPPADSDSAKAVDLIPPSGVFVSNHRPNLDGDPAPNSMNSTCRTNPGVKCEVRFTKDGTTKTLGPDTVGQDGLISWDWKLQDIGLTEGTWQITAVASQGGQNKSVTDSIPLEVGQ